MSKPKINPRTLAQASKLASFHCKEVEAMALDTARKIHEDQATWLDGVMKDLLPPDLYEAGLKMDRQEEIAAYVQKHGIAVIIIPDTFRMRVMLRGKVHAEFQAQLTVDGEPVSMTPKNQVDGAQN